ncbi:unnamed protein product, partial [Amoebophrya sp. A120]|eukprot:GSA120T00019802001.1
MTTNKANSKNKFKMRSSPVFRCLLSVSLVLQTSLHLLSEQGQVFVHATSDDEAITSTPSRPKTGRIWRSGSGLKRSSNSEDGVLSAASGTSAGSGAGSSGDVAMEDQQEKTRSYRPNGPVVFPSGRKPLAFRGLLTRAAAFHHAKSTSCKDE